MEPASQDLGAWDADGVLGTPPSVLQLFPLSGLGGRGKLSLSLSPARRGTRGPWERDGMWGAVSNTQSPPPPVSPALMQAEAAQPLNHSPRAAL